MQRIIKQISALTRKKQVGAKQTGNYLWFKPKNDCQNASPLNCLRSISSSEGAAIYGGIAYSESPATLNQQATAKQTETVTDNSANWSNSLQNVLDQPPSTLPFRMMLGGMAFCLAFGIWATYGHIEEVGSAKGLLVPEGEALKVNPIVMGKVVRIAVKEGDTVKAGQVLLELDRQIALKEIDRLVQEQASYQTQLLQTAALIDKTRRETQTYAEIAEAKNKAQLATIAQAKEKIRTTTELLAQLQTEAEAYKVRRDKLIPLAPISDELLKQLQTDAIAWKDRWQRIRPLTTTAQDLLQKLQEDADAAKERVQRLKPLVEQGALPKERLADLEQAWRDRQRAVTEAKLAQDNNLKEQVFQAEQTWHDRQRAIIQTELQQVSSVKEQLFQAEQAWRDRQRAIIQTQSDVQQANSELNRLEAEQKQSQAEAQTTQIQNQQKIEQLEVQKTQIQAKVTETEQLLSKAQAEVKQLTFTAPVDGVVSSLNVRNPGEVVQPGQTIIELAPQDAPLVLLAKLPNQEAGFVKNGMAVKIKFDAYPYQDFGIVSGKVRSISPDAKPDQQLGAVYRLEVELEHNFLTKNQQRIPFKAGQTASADIIIRERRIIDVLLDPIKQMQQGGLDL